MITVEITDEYSGADGKGKEKVRNAFKPKTEKERMEAKVERTRSRNTNKDNRIANRTKRKNERIKKRLDKANAKLKPGATPLTEKDLPNGKQRFVGFFKTLFKRKTKNPTTGKEETTYFEKKSDGTNVDLKPSEVQIIPTKIPNVEPLAVSKKAIDEAKDSGATITLDAKGNVTAEYGEDDVFAIDGADGSTEYYASKDVENKEDAKDSDGNPATIFTTKNILIGLGAIALVGGLVYWGSKGSGGAK
jgi:hypothetical protein